MKKYPIKYFSAATVFLSALFLFLLNSLWLGAQTRVAYQEDRNPKYVDITVANEGAYLLLTTVGGDGGSAKDRPHSGGAGTMVSGLVKIGNGTNEIPVGATLRFIPGEAGHSWGKYGGGGGGTGIAFQANSDAEWQLLAVAGGGGGAGFYNAGRPGATSTNGSDGLDYSGNTIKNAGGTNGNGGKKGNGNAFGGGGTYGAGEEDHWGGKAGMAEINNNKIPEGGEGGHNIDLTQETLVPSGGFGFSGGGAGYKDAGGGTFYCGGGGGGYSGGGGGGHNGGGGGGGSYLNATYMNLGIKESRGTTLSPQHGYVLYQYLDQLPEKAIQFAYNTGKCIDDYGGSTSDGTNIQTYNCHGDNNQQWILAPLSRMIRSSLDLNKCLDLNSSNTTNGTNIQLWHCNGSNAQKWLYNGIHKTIHSGVNSDKCFDATNGSSNSSANVNVQIWDCKYGNSNMRWVIEGATTVSDPATVKHIAPVLATSFAVHSHEGNVSGSNIQLWTKDNTNYAEQWYFDGLAIKMRSHQNLCIDLSSSNTSNGNNIQLYNCNGTNAQKWIYDGMTRTIRSAINPDKCMQIEKNTDGVYGKRSNVEIYDCNGSQEQLFTIQE